jgi:tetratricopeptide (TPR) repeat protein
VDGELHAADTALYAVSLTPHGQPAAAAAYAALTALRAGKLPEARRAAEIALRQGPGNSAVLLAAAMVAQAAGAHPRALALLDRAELAGGDVAQLRMLRGAIRKASGDLRGAEDDLAEAARLKPDDVGLRQVAGYFAARAIKEGRQPSAPVPLVAIPDHPQER